MGSTYKVLPETKLYEMLFFQTILRAYMMFSSPRQLTPQQPPKEPLPMSKVTALSLLPTLDLSEHSMSGRQALVAQESKVSAEPMISYPQYLSLFAGLALASSVIFHHVETTSLKLIKSARFATAGVMLAALGEMLYSTTHGSPPPLIATFCISGKVLYSAFPVFCAIALTDLIKSHPQSNGVVLNRVADHYSLLSSGFSIMSFAAFSIVSHLALAEAPAIVQSPIWLLSVMTAALSFFFHRVAQKYKGGDQSSASSPIQNH